jgi:hypothetical protein
MINDVAVELLACRRFAGQGDNLKKAGSSARRICDGVPAPVRFDAHQT